MSVTRAKVIVTLDIPVKGTWGDDCTLAQVYKQAVEEARGILRRHFNLCDGLVAGSPCDKNENHPVTILNFQPVAVTNVDRDK